MTPELHYFLAISFGLSSKLIFAATGLMPLKESYCHTVYMTVNNDLWLCTGLVNLALVVLLRLDLCIGQTVAARTATLSLKASMLSMEFPKI